jgi:hypothetical protein
MAMSGQQPGTRFLHYFSSELNAELAADGAGFRYICAVLGALICFGDLQIWRCVEIDMDPVCGDMLSFIERRCMLAVRQLNSILRWYCRWRVAWH